jgi:4-nitrophenyl phosphatase
MIADSFTYALVNKLIHIEIATKNAVFFDLDGVIWQGQQMIEGANTSITAIQELKKIMFITNNSSKTRLQYVERLAQLGIHITEEEILTSGYAASVYLGKNAAGSQIFVVGEEGLKSELENHDLVVVDNITEGVDYVLVGLDRRFTYNKLAHALTAILNGAQYLATNDDVVLPTEHGLLPGSGALVSALNTCARKTPEITFGKPNPFMLELALNHLGIQAKDAVMIGDRIETDISAAKHLDMFSILVLSGVTSLNDLKSYEIVPDLVLATINDLIE